MIGLVVDIFEGDDEFPTVTHVFYGKTEREARGVAEAHEGTDSFYRGAVRGGSWNGIPLTVEEQVITT